MIFTGLAIGLIVGSIGAGFVIAILIGSSFGERESAAYLQGFKDGKRAER